MAGVTSFQLVIPAPLRAGKPLWLSMNQRLHWAQKAEVTKTWRLLAKSSAQAQGLPKNLGKGQPYLETGGQID